MEIKKERTPLERIDYNLGFFELLWNSGRHDLAVVHFDKARALVQEQVKKEAGL